ncbi:MAG: aspartate carbamoyltransferase regulatory subunit [Planctomycetota bacterium]
MSKERGLIEVQAIKDGTVIDHIPSSTTLRVVEILAHFEDFVTIGVNFPSKRLGRKGVVKITNRFLSDQEVNTIALLAHGATVNIIRDYTIVEKHQVTMPEEIVGLIVCNNPKCITNVDGIPTRFHVGKKEPLSVTCHHCERPMEAKEIRLRAKGHGGRSA